MNHLDQFLDKMAAELTSKGRDQVAEKNFALPEEKKYPIHDMEHARNALARVSQNGTEAERKKVREAVYRKYPSLREGFEQQHGASPLSKNVVTKKTLGDVQSVSKSAQFMGMAMSTAVKTAAKLDAEYADAAIKTAASQLVKAFHAGKVYVD